MSVRRFWTNVAVTPHADGFQILLDGKAALTPARAPLATRHLRLAEAVAAEWAAAGEIIDPRMMPMTGFLNAIIDRVGPNRAALAGDVARYAEYELLCYRAAYPAELARRQALAWDPLLRWCGDTFGAVLLSAEGVLSIQQPSDAIARLTFAVNALDDYRLAVAVKLAGLYKSTVLTLAVVHGHCEGSEAYDASRIEEDYQAEQWGLDAEAARRVARERSDLAEACRLLSLLDGEG